MDTEKEIIINKNEAEMYFKDIKKLIIDSRNNIYRTVNVEMLSLYWNIGKIIMEIQEGKERANYGEKILENVSIKLTEEFGKGFSKRNLRRMRRFYCLFPIWSSVMTKLTWTHYLVIIGIEEEYKRNFYMKEAINSNWSVRELQRQKDSLLYERLILSKDKESVKELSLQGQVIKESKDLIKDPFVLEFLDIEENTNYLESDLEKNILAHFKRIFT